MARDWRINRLLFNKMIMKIFNKKIRFMARTSKSIV